jgi:small-conductance mechanosensitive channel
LASPGKPTNPLLQGLYLVVGGLLLIGTVLMGAVILAIVLSAALVLGIAFWARWWWLKRMLARTNGPRNADGQPHSGEVIDVEYTVVEQPDPRRRS